MDAEMETWDVLRLGLLNAHNRGVDVYEMLEKRTEISATLIEEFALGQAVLSREERRELEKWM